MLVLGVIDYQTGKDLRSRLLFGSRCSSHMVCGEMGGRFHILPQRCNLVDYRLDRGALLFASLVLYWNSIATWPSSWPLPSLFQP
jgi:hypothetical protein